MKEVFVNRILNDEDVLRGVIVRDKTIVEGLEIIFDETMRAIINGLIRKLGHEGFYSFDRFYQFVVYLNCRPQLGITIELIDFTSTKNVNAAFDYTLKLRGAGWTDADRDKIMDIAQEIKKNSENEQAKMIIKDPL
jgi:hypothetical protein